MEWGQNNQSNNQLFRKADRRMLLQWREKTDHPRYPGVYSALLSSGPHRYIKQMHRYSQSFTNQPVLTQEGARILNDLASPAYPSMVQLFLRCGDVRHPGFGALPPSNP